MVEFFAGVSVGAVVSLVWQAWRLADLRMRLAASEERHDAYRLADTRGDLDVVGPVTPPEPTRVTPYDWSTEYPELTR